MAKAKSRVSSSSRIWGSKRIRQGLEERAGPWSRLLELPLLWGVLATLACSWLLVARSSGSLPVWGPGEVATFDVTIPRDMAVPDAAATESVRQEAREQVLPVYDLEPRLQLELGEALRVLFATCRQQLEVGAVDIDTLGTVAGVTLDESMGQVLAASECSPALETALVEVTGQLNRARIVDDRRALEDRADRGLTLRNLNTGTEQLSSLAELSDAIDFRGGVEAAARNRLLEHDAVLRRWIRPTVDFFDVNLQPNLVFNRAETATRLAAAAAQVTPRSQVFRRGQVLIRRGDTVTSAAARTLKVMNEQRRTLTTFSTVVGVVLLVVLMLLGWWRILKRLTLTGETRSRLSTVFILLMLFVAMNRLGLFVATAIAQQSRSAPLSAVESYLWAVPYAAGAITVVMLLGMQVAVLFALCQALIAGMMLGGDFAVVVYALASGLVAALAVRQFKDRAVFTRAGVLVGVVNAAVLMVLQLYQGLPIGMSGLAVGAAFAVLGGPLSVGIASFLLPVLERVFGITTDMRLLELSNQNLPLLKRLSLEAPGTYQHSLAVGNLVEAGASAVGADSLVLRVCAYYHDIGKLMKPDYFVENQRGGNPHDAIAPSMSALVILSHVKEGLSMAHKERLPLPIRQAIASHHGTKLIRFFFNKASEQQDPGLGEVRESDYRYPGPKPHTKEMGILLLADAVEAAARTLEHPTPSKIQNMVNRIFADALQDGQLDDTELTFKELDKVATAFLWVLTNMYHHRIDYPGFDFNRRQERRDSGTFQMGPKTIAGDG